MAPILIDNRGLIKLGLISLLTVFVVFSAGYFSGYQKASLFYTAAIETEDLALPERNLVEISDINYRSPETISAGEEIDVDQPVVANVMDDQDKINKSKDVESITAENDVASAKQPIETGPLSETSIKVVEKASPAENIHSADFSTVDISSLTNDQLNEIKYSVQVGMYGNLVNAENMVEMLQAKQFDAYVADYTNKKNEIRYNVRFGYFANKKAATTGLKKYKEVEKGDGYLVNFSIDNIVKLADKNTIKDNVKPASSIDTNDENKPSGTGAGKVTHNKVSQEKYLSRLQSEALINN